MKKIIIILLAVIITVLIFREQKEVVIIPDSSIRLRVIPNSNSSVDQKIKLKVKEYLENNTIKELNNSNNIEEVRNQIKENIPIIEKNIDTIFAQNNYNMKYNISYGYNYFPEKTYNSIKYKEGYYESIVIKIGEAKGDNWWCVLFPNLCLVDLENKEDIEYESWIKETFIKYFK